MLATRVRAHAAPRREWCHRAPVRLIPSRPYVLTADPRSAPRAGRAAPPGRPAPARAEGTLGACVPVEVTAFGFSLDFVDRVRFELFQNAGNRIKRDAQDSLAQESARRELPATRRPQPAWVSRRGKVASSPGRRAVPRRPAARSSGNTMY